MKFDAKIQIIIKLDNYLSIFNIEKREVKYKHFASQFKDDLARQYYITGAAGEPKRITLDRSLVQDRSGLIM